jgi:hypothetical protein
MKASEQRGSLARRRLVASARAHALAAVLTVLITSGVTLGVMWVSTVASNSYAPPGWLGEAAAVATVSSTFVTSLCVILGLTFRLAQRRTGGHDALAFAMAPLIALPVVLLRYSHVALGTLVISVLVSFVFGLVFSVYWGCLLLLEKRLLPHPDGTCPRCGYDTTGLWSDRCPECRESVPRPSVV